MERAGNQSIQRRQVVLLARTAASPGGSGTQNFASIKGGAVRTSACKTNTDDAASSDAFASGVGCSRCVRTPSAASPTVHRRSRLHGRRHRIRGTDSKQRAEALAEEEGVAHLKFGEGEHAAGDQVRGDQQERHPKYGVQGRAAGLIRRDHDLIFDNARWSSAEYWGIRSDR